MQIKPPDTALAFINELLAVDFMELPANYRHICGSASFSNDGYVTLSCVNVVDGGNTRITLHLGKREHSVTLHYPAFGAPKALVQWYRKFLTLVKARANWLKS